MYPPGSADPSRLRGLGGIANARAGAMPFDEGQPIDVDLVTFID